MFKIENLDHVAIFVEDVTASIDWYKRVLGLEQVHEAAWSNHPAMLFTGNTGVAIFPAKSPNLPNPSANNYKRIDHFAFYVTKENFEQAKVHYESLEISYKYKNHTIYESLYIEDLDGHIVELTTIVK